MVCIKVLVRWSSPVCKLKTTSKGPKGHATSCVPGLKQYLLQKTSYMCTWYSINALKCYIFLIKGVYLIHSCSFILPCISFRSLTDKLDNNNNGNVAYLQMMAGLIFLTNLSADIHHY